MCVSIYVCFKLFRKKSAYYWTHNFRSSLVKFIFLNGNREIKTMWAGGRQVRKCLILETKKKGTALCWDAEVKNTLLEVTQGALQVQLFETQRSPLIYFWRALWLETPAGTKVCLIRPSSMNLGAFNTLWRHLLSDGLLSLLLSSWNKWHVRWTKHHFNSTPKNSDQ